MAGAAGAQQRPEHAARLFAAEALREALHAPLEPSSRARYERDVAAVLTTLAAETLAAAWAEGRRMTPEQALARHP